MKILIVDDYDPSRIHLQVILRSVGYNDFIMAKTAEEAIIRLRNLDKEANQVDLILMDVEMPGMNGMEATRFIKSNPLWTDIPILMVTATEQKSSLKKAFEAGAMDYITKPVDKIELEARVGSALKLKKEMDRRKARERELEALTLELQTLSNLDGLTRIANRRCFDQRFAEEWLRARREKAPLFLLMLDIDFFKRYNDTYGHLQGDGCLKTVADLISRTIRRPADFPARYGGEEFVVLLPHTNLEGALHVAEAIQKGVNALAIEHQSSELGGQVTVSIGLAGTVPGLNESADSLLDAADQALYRAKQNGRNQCYLLPGWEGRRLAG